MQSYYSVIKNASTTSGEVKVVATSYNKVNELPDTKEEEVIQSEEVSINYSELAEEILKDAENKRDEIISMAYEKAKQIEKEAYENAYNQGLENGFEDGKQEAINRVLPAAEEEAEKLRKEASEVLLTCHEKYNAYLKEKESEIIKLSLSIAEKILRKHIEEDEIVSNMVNEVIESFREAESIIIKTNPIHYEEIKSNIPKWKHNYAIQGEIFAIEDTGMEEGNAILEKPSGKVVVGIDIGLEKIKEALLS